MSNLLDYVGLGHFLTKLKALFVTGLGTSGNYLTWTRNGTINNITIPYASKAVSIPVGYIDSTSTSTDYTVTVDGITELEDGVCFRVTNSKVTSVSGCTIDVNQLGAKPMYSTGAAASRITTTFTKDRTYLLIYNSTRVSGGCWDIGYLTDANTTYSAMTTAAILTGTATTARTITAAVLAEAYNINNGVITIGANSITPLTQHLDISGKEDISNKVTSLSSSSTDILYPSAKCVFDTALTKANKDYLTLEALESGTINFSPTSGNENLLSYSKNGDAWTIGSSVTVVTGDKVMFKGNMIPVGQDSGGGIGTFGGKTPVTTIRFRAYGNVMSLLYGDDFTNELPLKGTYTFNSLFRSTNLTDARHLTIPAITLVDHCYWKMFYQCALLVSMPNLPATTLNVGCYGMMFLECTNLVDNIPNILPVMALALDCYGNMFYGCTSLVKAPQLPATTLANNCYTSMFEGCTNLEEAPILPAKTLTAYCYYKLFAYCAKIKFIKCLATDITASSSRSSWVSGVNSTGIFILDDSASSWTTGINGIPTGWSVYTESLWKEVRHYELDSINVKTPIVEHGTSDTTFALTPGIYHKWGSVSSLTLTLDTPADLTILNEYIFSFTSPATPTTLSLPASVEWVVALDIEANKQYRVSIIDNLATWITSNMVVSIGDVNTPEFATKAYVDAGLADKEDNINKVTSIDSSSTDTLYPSAKAVYDALNPS